MTLDSTNSLSAAPQTHYCRLDGKTRTLQGKQHAEPAPQAGPAIKSYTKSSSPLHHDNAPATGWCYIFVHNQRVRAVEEQLRHDGRPYFIHKSIKYVPRHKDGTGGARSLSVPTVSGLVFLQGTPADTQLYLDNNLPPYHLCKDCSNGRVAIIPHSQMTPFMRIAQADPERIRFLLHPFHYYAQNRTLLRITSGPFAGIEGYVIRISRDRRLVMQVGGMSIALSGVHAERFEEVGKHEAATRHEDAARYPRALHERNAFIDHYFHPVRTQHEAAAQAESIDLLRQQLLADTAQGKIDPAEAYEMLHFMVEESDYYYAPLLPRFSTELEPVTAATSRVMQAISALIAQLPANSPTRQLREAEYDELVNRCGYWVLALQDS